jgi:D-ribulokinase
VRDVPLCYPLTGHGERFPFVRPDARGFLGAHPLPVDRGGVDDPARAFAAVCTGLSHVERLCFDLLHDAGADVTGPISFTGGGARNDWWNQLRCDQLGVPVRLPASAEPAVGMAVLAAGVTDGDVSGAATRLVHTRAVLQPDPHRSAALAPGYAAFLAALTERGWLDPRTAEHARRRAAA